MGRKTLDTQPCIIFMFAFIALTLLSNLFIFWASPSLADGIPGIFGHVAYGGTVGLCYIINTNLDRKSAARHWLRCTSHRARWLSNKMSLATPSTSCMRLGNKTDYLFHRNRNDSHTVTSFNALACSEVGTSVYSFGGSLWYTNGSDLIPPYLFQGNVDIIKDGEVVNNLEAEFRSGIQGMLSQRWLFHVVSSYLKPVTQRVSNFLISSS